MLRKLFYYGPEIFLTASLALAAGHTFVSIETTKAAIACFILGLLSQATEVSDIGASFVQRNFFHTSLLSTTWLTGLVGLFILCFFLWSGQTSLANALIHEKISLCFFCGLLGVGAFHIIFKVKP